MNWRRENADNHIERFFVLVLDHLRGQRIEASEQVTIHLFGMNAGQHRQKLQTRLLDLRGQIQTDQIDDQLRRNRHFATNADAVSANSLARRLRGIRRLQCLRGRHADIARCRIDHREKTLQEDLDGIQHREHIAHDQMAVGGRYGFHLHRACFRSLRFGRHGVLCRSVKLHDLHEAIENDQQGIDDLHIARELFVSRHHFDKHGHELHHHEIVDGSVGQRLRLFAQQRHAQIQFVD